MESLPVPSTCACISLTPLRRMWGLKMSRLSSLPLRRCCFWVLSSESIVVQYHLPTQGRQVLGAKVRYDGARVPPDNEHACGAEPVILLEDHAERQPPEGIVLSNFHNIISIVNKKEKETHVNTHAHVEGTGKLSIIAPDALSFNGPVDEVHFI